MSEAQLKKKYIFYERNKEMEEDYSDPVLALTVNYTENILKIKEKIYEDIAKELLYFISNIYFENYNKFIEFQKVLINYKMVLLMENNEVGINNNLLNEVKNNFGNPIEVIIFIDKAIKNKKIFFLENTDDDLKTNKNNHTSFLETNDLNLDDIELYIDDKKYKSERYFVPENEGKKKSHFLSNEN